MPARTDCRCGRASLLPAAPACPSIHLPLSPYLPISLSPYLLISLSPYLPISLSPYLHFPSLTSLPLSSGQLSHRVDVRGIPAHVHCLDHLFDVSPCFFFVLITENLIFPENDHLLFFREFPLFDGKGERVFQVRVTFGGTSRQNQDKNHCKDEGARHECKFTAKYRERKALRADTPDV